MKTWRHIRVNPIAGALGAAIEGVDLARRGNADFAEVRAALLDYQVVFFRDQNLTRERHQAFARRFGALHIHSFGQQLRGEGYPEEDTLGNCIRSWCALTCTGEESVELSSRPSNDASPIAAVKPYFWPPTTKRIRLRSKASICILISGITSSESGISGTIVSSSTRSWAS